MSPLQRSAESSHSKTAPDKLRVMQIMIRRDVPSSAATSQYELKPSSSSRDPSGESSVKCFRRVPNPEPFFQVAQSLVPRSATSASRFPVSSLIQHACALLDPACTADPWSLDNANLKQILSFLPAMGHIQRLVQQSPAASLAAHVHAMFLASATPPVPQPLP